MGMFTAIHVASGKSAAAPALRVDTIVGSDYAFTYSRTLSPGLHHLAFVNAGKQRHEVSIALLARDATMQKVLDVIKADGDVDALIDEGLGVLHSPGGSKPAGLLDINLLPGREYMLLCEFADSTKAPPHVALGMFGSIHVRGKAVR